MSSAAAASKVHGPIYTRILRKLTEGLRPVSLTLRDQSHLHAHHVQSPKRPETHFDVHIISSTFEGMSLLQRQRKVFDLLHEEMLGEVHALSMTTRTPKEHEQRDKNGSGTTSTP